MSSLRATRRGASAALSVFFLALIACLRSETEEYETLSVGTCMTSQTEQLSLTCVEGHVVRLIRSFLGHSVQSTCQYSDGDCVMDLPVSVEDDDCTGTNTCQVFIREKHRRKIIPRCRKTGNYLQALYQCIPVSSIRSVCDSSHGVVVGQKGFLRTPGYPSNYPDDLDCNFTLIAPHHDQRFMLFVVDLDLEPMGRGCSDWLQVFDGFQSITLCNRRTRYWLRNSTQGLFHIRMHSDNSTSERGFWLYYEAFPFFPSIDPVGMSSPLRSTTTLPPPPPPPSPPIASVLINTLLRRTSSSPPPPPPPPPMTSPSLTATDHVVYVTSEGASLPLIVLMGVAVALIVCVFVTLLVFVFIKSRSSSNRPDRGGKAPQWTHSPHPKHLTTTDAHSHALIVPPSSTQLYHSNSVKMLIDNKQDNC